MKTIFSAQRKSIGNPVYVRVARHENGYYDYRVHLSRDERDDFARSTEPQAAQWFWRPALYHINVRPLQQHA